MQRTAKQRREAEDGERGSRRSGKSPAASAGGAIPLVPSFFAGSSFSAGAGCSTRRRTNRANQQRRRLLEVWKKGRDTQVITIINTPEANGSDPHNEKKFCSKCSISFMFEVLEDNFVDLLSPEALNTSHDQSNLKQNCTTDQRTIEYSKALLVGRRLFDGNDEDDYNDSNNIGYLYFLSVFYEHWFVFVVMDEGDVVVEADYFTSTDGRGSVLEMDGKSSLIIISWMLELMS